VKTCRKGQSFPLPSGAWTTTATDWFKVV